MKIKAGLLASCVMLTAGYAHAQTVPDSADSQTDQITDIVVTAQKRSETANKVPLSISAFSGNSLRDMGVSQIADLAKITPGLQVTRSAYSTPIYTIRGVGFNESSVGARPTVTVYVDEAPLPFAQMTPIATLDLERVEVLKGPQGILFGQNSTGGAINFIAAKPTRDVAAGLDVSYGRFGAAELSGFVSGPITDTLGVRVALRTEQGGAWQKSYTRDDELGSANRIFGRVIFEWKPTDRLRMSLNVNRFIDQSEGQAAQFAYLTPLNPDLLAEKVPAYFTYPTAPHKARAADWSPDDRPSRDNRQTQTVLRTEYDLNDELTLTSLTSYARYKEHRVEDPDGVSLQDFTQTIDSSIRSISQEVRMTGNVGPALRFIVGGNYEESKVRQYNLLSYAQNSNAYALEAFGGTYESSFDRSAQKIESYAGFANVDYDIGDTLTAHGGLRYTQYNIDFRGCSGDPGDGRVGGLFTAFANFLRSANGQDPIAPIAPGACFTLDETNTPVEVAQTFKQNNWSWRGGLDWKPADGTLIYVSASKGYKAGSYPLLPASVTNQFTPVSQESVMAYEAGFKLSLFDRKMQLNGAGFYYDYRDKQIRANTEVPIFGQLERLINVPKSRIVGAELQATVLPVRGLTLNLGGTFVDSKVREGMPGIFGVYGDPIDITGERFPLTPRWQGMADIVYDAPMSDRLNAFAGATLTAQSRTSGGFGEEPELDIKGYALLDLRAGIHAADDSWRIWIFGRNVTNRYYWVNVSRVGDTTSRFAGRPVTYGVTLSLRTP